TLEQQVGIPLRFDQAEREAGRGLVLVFEDQLERLHAAVTGDKETAKITQHALQRKQQGLDAIDAVIELDAALVAGRWLVTGQRFANKPAHAIEMEQGGRADATAQF